MRQNPTVNKFVRALNNWTKWGPGLKRNAVTKGNKEDQARASAGNVRYVVPQEKWFFDVPSERGATVPTETINLVYKELTASSLGRDHDFPFEDKLWVEKSALETGLKKAGVALGRQDGVLKVMKRDLSEPLSTFGVNDPTPTRDQVNNLLMRVAKDYGLHGDGLARLSENFNEGAGEQIATRESLEEAAKDAKTPFEEPNDPERDPTDPTDPDPDEPDEPGEETGERGFKR